MGYLKLVPGFVWWMLGGAILVGLIALRIHSYGTAQYKLGQSDLIAKQAKEIKKIQVKQEAVSQKVVIQYVDRVKVIHEKAKTIIKEIPYAVPAKADAACIVNSGFVRVWNMSNKGTASTASEGTDATPSDVVLSDIATQKATEAELCNGNTQQLISLQDWVRQQAAIH